MSMPRYLVSEGMDLGLEGFESFRHNDSDRPLKSNIWSCPPPPTPERWAKIIDECTWWPEEHKDMLRNHFCPNVKR